MGRGAALAVSAAGALLVVNLYEGIWAVWNPTMAVPVLFTTVLLCSFADDWEWALPLAVFGISLMVQFHIGYAGAAAVLMAVLAWRIRPTRRAVAATAAVVGVTWILPATDQMTGSGNLRDLASFALTNDEETVGLKRSLGIVARELSPIGPWIGGSEPTGFFGGVTPISPVWLLVPVAALAMLAHHSRAADPAMRTFVVTLVALSIASVVMVSRITEAPFPYLVMWIRAIAALIWGMVAYVAVMSRSRLAVPGATAAIGAIAVASFTVVNTRIDTFESRATRALERAALDAIPVGTQVELVFTEFFPGAGEGIALTLESRGRNTSISAEPEDRVRLGRMWGEHRLVGAEQPTKLAFARDDDIDDLVAQGWKLLARLSRSRHPSGSAPARTRRSVTTDRPGRGVTTRAERAVGWPLRHCGRRARDRPVAAATPVQPTQGIDSSRTTTASSAAVSGSARTRVTAVADVSRRNPWPKST